MGEVETDLGVGEECMPEKIMIATKQSVMKLRANCAKIASSGVTTG